MAEPYPGANTRLIRFAEKYVEREWKGSQKKLGSRIERALVAEEILRLLTTQDEEVSDARVRELAIESYLLLMDV